MFTKKFKTITIILICLMVPLSNNVQCVAAENEQIDIHITVTDITDVTNPFNVLVPRRELNISYFDIEEEYGSAFCGIECIEGITYMHAIIKLHEELYGKSNVTDNLLMYNETGETVYFMGRLVASIMYKNGDDIFNLPQHKPLHDGDELNICLYDFSHAQQVATFDKAYVDRVSLGDTVDFTVNEHLGSPQTEQPIAGAEITNENGIYITDENGEVITSDDSGGFSITFDNTGTYQISIMPSINYYYDTDVNGTLTEYYIEEELHTVARVSGMIYDTDTEELLNDPIIIAAKEKNPEFSLSGSVCYFVWGDEPEIYDYTYTTKTVRTREIDISGEPRPQITYTTPFAIVDVSTDFWITSVEYGRSEQEGHDNLWVFGRNWEYNNGSCIVAMYDDNDTLVRTLFKDFSTASNNNVNFVWNTDTDVTRIKLMCWSKDNVMQPLSLSYEIEADGTPTNITVD